MFHKDIKRQVANIQRDASSNREKLLKTNFLDNPPKYDKLTENTPLDKQEGEKSAQSVIDRKTKLSTIRTFVDKLKKWDAALPYPPHQWLSSDGEQGLTQIHDNILIPYRDKHEAAQYKHDQIKTKIQQERANIDKTYPALTDRQKQSLSKVLGLIGEKSKLEEMYLGMEKAQEYIKDVGKDLANISKEPGYQKDVSAIRTDLISISTSIIDRYPDVQKRLVKVKLLLRINDSQKQVENQTTENQTTQEVKTTVSFEKDYKDTLLKKQVEELTNESEHHQQRVEGLINERNHLQQQFNIATQERETLRAKYNNDIEAKEADITQKQEQIEHITRNMQDTQKELDQTKTENRDSKTAIEQKLSEKQKLLDDVQEQLTKITKEKEQIETTSKVTIKEIEQKLSEKQKLLDDVQEKLTKITKEKEQMETTSKVTIKEIEQQLSEKQEQLEKLQEKLTKITTEKSSVEKKSLDQQRQIDENKTEIAELEAQITKLKNKLELQAGNLPPTQQGRGGLTQLFRAFGASSPKSLEKSTPPGNTSTNTNVSPPARTPLARSQTRSSQYSLNSEFSKTPQGRSVHSSGSFYGKSVESTTSLSSDTYRDHHAETVEGLYNSEKLQSEDGDELKEATQAVCYKHLESIVTSTQKFFDARTELNQKEIVLINGEKGGNIGLRAKAKETLLPRLKDIVQEYERLDGLSLDKQNKGSFNEAITFQEERDQYKVAYNAIIESIEKEIKEKAREDPGFKVLEEQLKTAKTEMKEATRQLEREISKSWKAYKDINENYYKRRNKEIADGLKGTEIPPSERERYGGLKTREFPIRIILDKNMKSENRLEYQLRDHITFLNYITVATRSRESTFSEDDEKRILRNLDANYKDLKTALDTKNKEQSS